MYVFETSPNRYDASRLASATTWVGEVEYLSSVVIDEAHQSKE